MKFVFGDIVVVDGNQIGVVVKSWDRPIQGGVEIGEPHHDVYVRSYNAIKEYNNSEMERYQVRHKYLDEDDLIFQKLAERKP